MLSRMLRLNGLRRTARHMVRTALLIDARYRLDLGANSAWNGSPAVDGATDGRLSHGPFRTPHSTLSSPTRYSRPFPTPHKHPARSSASFSPGRSHYGVLGSTGRRMVVSIPDSFRRSTRRLFAGPTCGHCTRRTFGRTPCSIVSSSTSGAPSSLPFCPVRTSS